MCQIENTKLKNIMAIIGLNMSLKILRITGFLKTGSISQPGVPTNLQRWRNQSDNDMLKHMGTE
ncbi:MAG: hypothetical protein CM1200mP3_10270 [Chloroflexota bacterium]|nr:MAG: hypothetical protein CM1200mP3_10270 [Chloroflexota bacterium]